MHSTANSFAKEFSIPGQIEPEISQEKLLVAEVEKQTTGILGDGEHGE